MDSLATKIREFLAPIRGAPDPRPRNLAAVVVWCPFGHPAVVETASRLSDGAAHRAPLYVTCPSLASIVSSAEKTGAVNLLRRACAQEEWLRDLVQDAVDSYALRTVDRYHANCRSIVLMTRLGAGLGGPEEPKEMTCLHAFAATLLAVSAGWLNRSRDEVACDAVKAWLRFLPPVEECWCRDDRCSLTYAGHKDGTLLSATQFLTLPRPRRVRWFRSRTRRPIR